ncbi:hypothetical protein P879_06957 [Paragonimus westermani]|uniref:LIM zinc-binding domain-containing protein n=1 Tax=Paragonimus westermani TaxID=34504 RepID=A0A8T0DDR2_9TREM|nr:hypothetical protein P879_06957 [Paragonimus westermani]
MQTNYTPCHMNCSNPPSVETNLVKAYMAQSTKTPVLHWHNDQLAHEVRYSKFMLSRKTIIIAETNYILFPTCRHFTWTDIVVISTVSCFRFQVNDFVSVSSNNQSCTLSRSSSQRRSPVAWRPASPTTIQRSPTNRLSRSQSLRRSPNAWFNSTRILGRCCICDAGVNPHNHFTLNGKDYHFDCLNCTACGCRLGVENYHVHEGLPYCKAHFKQLSTN